MKVVFPRGAYKVQHLRVEIPNCHGIRKKLNWSAWKGSLWISEWLKSTFRTILLQLVTSNGHFTVELIDSFVPVRRLAWSLEHRGVDYQCRSMMRDHFHATRKDFEIGWKFTLNIYYFYCSFFVVLYTKRTITAEQKNKIEPKSAISTFMLSCR